MKYILASIFLLIPFSPIEGAIAPGTTWYIRILGDTSNSGGYDPTIPSAGVNYADSDTAYLSITDLATTSATAVNVSSDLTTFTTDLAGNTIRISAGTNFTAGYYTIVQATSANMLVLDRTPSASLAGSAGVAKIGGAFPNLVNVCSGGTLLAPSIATPVVPGNTIMVQGSGSDSPTNFDYIYSSSYCVLPAGDTQAGLITVIGYNGRPMIYHPGTHYYQCNACSVQNHSFRQITNTYLTFGPISTVGTAYNEAINNKFDTFGQDAQQIRATVAIGNYIYNSSAGVTNLGSLNGSNYAIDNTGTHGKNVFGNYVTDVRGGCIRTAASTKGGVWHHNIFANSRSTGSAFMANVTGSYDGAITIKNNVFFNHKSTAIYVDRNSLNTTMFYNNIVSSNAGYGIDMPTNTALNDRITMSRFDYNNYFNNKSGDMSFLSYGPHDVIGDPGFTNPVTGGDFSTTNAQLRNAAFPRTFLGSTSTNNEDIGAVQSAGSSTSGSFNVME